ncbi:IclR family transcriptional regulator [Ideonella sp. A 288]|uniref:IclR family transcriptional regulator n=1 Tax=Ideonella sp. A 288 TaxID=1962181 RepID=UPI0018FE48FD|nr:IclR family transcriptional regulator C-terminal domain-containing protein [Ideonella sp. A 288]
MTGKTNDRRAARLQERSSLFVGSTEKAFKVLEAFNGPHRHMTMAEIARAADLDRSATQRLVHTLEALGYLRRIPDSLLYGLTSKVLRLSYNYLRANELIDRASPYLLEISRTLGETTNLQELDGHEIVFLARFPGRHLVNVDFAVGSRLPAVHTASGTAILSRFALAQRIEVLDRTPMVAITPHTELDRQRLLDRIQLAAEQGYAMVTNETVLGDISVAAPITDHRGLAVAAINISVPTTRWTLATAEAKLVSHVQVAATSISQAKFAGHEAR